MPSIRSPLGTIGLLGDSLSVMTAPTPGQQLAFLLAGAGHQVHVEALGGFALQYFRPKAARTKQGMQAAAMLSRIKDKSPDTVLVMLGTNDSEDSPAALKAGIRAIVDAFSGPGMQPRLLFIGPPSFSPEAHEGRMVSGTALVYDALKASLRQVIDSRPMTANVTEPPLRAKDLIHFSKGGAAIWANQLFNVLQGKEKITKTPQIGMGELIFGLGILDTLAGGPIRKAITKALTGNKE